MQQSPSGLNQEGPGSEPGTVAICFVAAALESVRARHLDADGLLIKAGLSLIGFVNWTVSPLLYRFASEEP